MSAVQRWAFDLEGTPRQFADGSYVLHADHERFVAELREAHEQALAEGRDPHRTCTSCWMGEHAACTRGENCLCRACDDERGYARGLDAARDAVDGMHLVAHSGDDDFGTTWNRAIDTALEQVDALRDPAPTATGQDVAEDRAEHVERDRGQR